MLRHIVLLADEATAEIFADGLTDTGVRLDCTPLVGQAVALLQTFTVDLVVVAMSAGSDVCNALAGMKLGAPVVFIATDDAAKHLLDLLRDRETAGRMHRAVIDYSADAMVVLDSRGIVLAGNAPAEHLFGVGKGELVGLRFGIPTAEVASELTVRREDGPPVDVEMRTIDIVWEAQPAWLATLRDLSDRRRADELARSKAAVEDVYHKTRHQLAVVLENLPVSLWAVDTNMNVIFRTGSLFDEIDRTRVRLEEVFALDGNEAVIIEAHSTALADGEAQFQWKSADRIYDVIIRRGGTSGSPDGLIGFVVDVSAQQMLEEGFRQAQKMEAIGRLAGGIAHDFNNLLTAILVYANFVKSALDEGDQAHEDVRGILDAADRAKSLTTQLLAFSRRQSVEPRVVGLNDVIANIDKMLCRILGEDIELVTRFGEQLWNTEIDPNAFEQVVMNLCVNARDAMPTGGLLTIETSNATISSTPDGAHGVDMEPGDYVVVSVADCGLGMTEAVRLHVFEPFFTTKSKLDGTGLGLSTCYGIIKQANGFIWARSKVGVGTTIEVYLPRCSGQKASLGGVRVDAASSGHESVLVVEDNDAIRQVVQRVLTGRGYTVHLADSGEAALRLVANEGPHIDLLLTDVVMPRMTGRQVADTLGKTHPRLKVMYMSGYTGNAIARHGVPNAGTVCLPKPFTPGQLAARVRHVLDSEGSTAASARSRILLVDDDHRLLRAMKNVLGTRYHVVTAVSGPAALEELSRQSFDLIVCDILMPGMSGPELLQTLESSDPVAAERVVFWTGAAADSSVKRFKARTKRHVLPKPVRAEQIESLLSRVRK